MSFADIAALTLHDVKNRLALLASQAEGKGDRETVSSALDAARLLTELLVYYKSETGGLYLNIEAHAPADLIDELAAEAGAISAIRIERQCAEAPPLAFYDPTLVRMVLANAVHNALRHARAQICLSAREVAGYCMFTVHDDGPGFPDSILADQGDAAPVTRAGTGLGLRLASRIAHHHEHMGRHGSLLLSNDHGGLFTLRLPV